MMKVRKFYFAWHEKKEKAFLEEMSLKGYRLIKIGLFSYYFEPCEPEERVYEADFRSYDKMSEDEYIQLFSDAGWEHDATFSGWYMFSRLKDENHMSIFSDIESLQDKYKRLLFFLMITGFPSYLYAFVIMPNLMSNLSTFYVVFRWVITVVVILHAMALIKIFSVYRKIPNKS